MRIEFLSGQVMVKRRFRRNVRNYLLSESALTRIINPDEIAAMLAASEAAELPHWIQRAVRKGLVLH
jgi:hypothetical protein